MKGRRLLSRGPLHPGALLLVMGMVSRVAVAEPAIVLESYTDDPPQDARHYVELLLRTMGDQTPLHGDRLKQEIEARISRSAGPQTAPKGIRSTVEEGRRFFIEGEFTNAIAQLEEARSTLIQLPALVASDQGLRDALHRALLISAHAYLRTNQGENATNRVSEVIRSFPDRDLSVRQYGPELVRLYRTIRGELDRQPRGTLVVTTQPTGCLVFINERFVGLSPARIVDLYPGRYRVYVQRPQARGRVHLVNVSGGEHPVDINFELDSALSTEPYVGLRFASEASRQELEVGYAATVGQALDAVTVILIGFSRYQGRRTLLGTTISTATRKTIRSGMIVLEPTPPAPETIKALGRFLVVGEGGEGVIIRQGRLLAQNLLAGSGGERDKRTPFFSARVFKWITLGLAVAGLGSGITLIALDQRGTCDAGPGVHCPEMYSTLVPGIVLTAAGGLFGGTAGYLFYRDARRPERAQAAFHLAPWIQRHQLGLTAWVWY